MLLILTSCNLQPGASPSPTATPSATAEPATATVRPSPTAAPTDTRPPSPTIAPTATDEPEPAATEEPDPTATDEPEPTATEEPEAAVTDEPESAPSEGEPVAEATESVESDEPGEIELTDELYVNPELGVRWAAPGEDWRFAEYPSELTTMILEDLVILNAPDGETSFQLSFLTFEEEVVGPTGPAYAANPDTFFERVEESLPEESAETSERVTVAGSEALRARVPQEDRGEILYWIVRPNGAFYLLVEAASEPNPQTEAAALETITFTEVELAPTATPQPTPESPEVQREELIEAVEDLRELETQEEVPFEFMSRDELRGELEEDIEEEGDREELEAADHVYKLLGLIPPETNLTELTLDLYTSQIAGFYDPEEDHFFLISDQQSELLSTFDRVIFAHEYVHALQDQHYDLEALRAEELGLNDDQESALIAVIEGDAQTVTGFYMVEHLSREDFNEFVTGGTELDEETLENTPQFLRESLTFPYVAGQAFVQQQLIAGYWEAVDALYSAPPQSTEQILHPERYPGDAPVEVELPDMVGALGAGWHEELRETWGEFSLRLLLDEQLSADEAVEGAEGWGGDQYLSLRSDAGDQLFVLDITWDEEDEATEFAGLYEEWLLAAGFQPAGDGRWKDATRIAELRLMDDRTVLLVASGNADLGAVLVALGADSD